MYLPLSLLVCLLFDVQVISTLPVEGTLSSRHVFLMPHRYLLKQPCFLATAGCSITMQSSFSLSPGPSLLKYMILFFSFLFCSAEKSISDQDAGTKGAG